MRTANDKGSSRATPRPLRLRIHSAMRWLHIYISMFSLLAVLFFSLTGITLNHPDWTFGNTETKRELSGQLPAGWKKGESVDWFIVAEHLRGTDGIKGRAQDTRSDEEESSVAFRAPGYTADCFIDQRTGSYTVNVTAQGFVGVMNDFHRGRDAGTAWAAVIDISGILLTLVSVTGLGLLWYLKKVRVAALVTMMAGSILVAVIIKLAM